MNKALVLFLGVAALGAAAFVLLREPGPAAGGDAGVQRSGDVTPGSAGEGTSTDELAGVAVDEAGVGRAVETADTVTAAGSRTGSDATSDGEATHAKIFGVVTDVYGAPIQGADVLLRRASIEDLWLDEPAADARLTATSAQDGSFEFESRSGKLEILVGADGYAPLEQTLEAVAGEPQDLRELRLAQGVTLIGRVVDSAGAGVKGAKLVRKPVKKGGLTIIGRTEAVAAVTDANGGFEIQRQAAGPFHFFVRHDDHPMGTLEGRTERPGETMVGLEVTLPLGTELSGTVTGIPPGLSGLKVVALAAGNGAFDMNFGASTERTAEIEDDGTFRIRGVLPGTTVRVGLVAGRYTWDGRTRRSQWVRVECPIQRAPDPVQLTFSEGASVTFRTMNPDGEAMLPESVEAGFSYAMTRENLEQNEATGETTVDRLWPDEEGQILELNLASKGYADWSASDVKLYPGEALDLGVITFEARPAVEVTVVDDATGKPIEGAHVEVRAPRDTDSVRVSMRLSSDGDDEPDMDFGGDSSSAKTNDKGVALVDTTAGATVEIAVTDGAHAPYVSDPIQLPEIMTVYASEVRLAPGCVLRIIAKDAAGNPGGGIRVEHKGDDAMRALGRGPQRTNGEGVLVMKGLAPGEHRVRLAGRGGSSGIFVPRISIGGDEPDDDSWTLVEIAAGAKASVTLLAPSLSSLTGKVTEAKAALVGARLKLRKKDASEIAGLMNLGGDSKMETTSDARGTFELDDVEEGEYELVVEHATRSMPSVHPVTLKAGENEIELDLDVTEVVGRVLDAEGKPVAGATVKAEKAQEEGGRQVLSVVMMGSEGGGGGAVMFASGDDSEPSVTDFEGRYRLRGVTPDVELYVKASKDGFDDAKSEPFTVAEGSVKENVEPRFAEPGSLRIEVEGGSGMLLALIRRKDAGPGTAPKVQQLKGGAVDVEGLAPGKVIVSIQSAGGTTLDLDPETHEVEIVAGETATVTFEVK